MKETSQEKDDVNQDSIAEDRTKELSVINERLSANISERQKAEYALQASEERFRNLVETTTDWIWEVDKRGVYTYASPAVRYLLGYEPEDVIGKTPFDLMPAEEAKRVSEIFGPLIAEHKPINYLENINLHKDGRQVILESCGVPFFDPNGKLLGYRGVDRDITERKKAEEELARQSRTLDSFFNYSITPLVILDRHFNFVRVNKAYAVAGQRDVSEFPGHNHFEFYPSDAKIIFEQVIKTKEPYQTFARPFSYPDHPEWGLTYWDWTLTPILSDTGEVEFLVFSLKDVTEQKRAEEKLQKSERMKTILNRIANVFLAVPDEEVYAEVLRVVLDVMESSLGIFGFIAENGDLVIPSLSREVWSECQVTEKSIVFPPHKWGGSLWGRAIREKKAFYSNNPLHTPEGHIPIANFLAVPIIFGDKTIGLLSVANKDGGYTEEDKGLLESIANSISPILNTRLQRDLQKQEREHAEDEKNKLQSQLLHAQKMEAIGTLAGGVAHDFNNILNVIMGYGTMLLERLGDDAISREQMNEVLAAAEKAANLTKRLLIFCRKQVIEIKPVDVNEIILGMEKMLSRIIREDIVFAMELTDCKLPVMADAGQIEQVLMNLVSNARDAMPKGGRLTISTAITKMDDAYRPMNTARLGHMPLSL